MANKENQEALDFLIGYPRVIIKGRCVSVEKLSNAYTTLQQAIEDLELYKKALDYSIYLLQLQNDGKVDFKKDPLLTISESKESLKERILKESEEK